MKKPATKPAPETDFTVGTYIIADDGLPSAPSLAPVDPEQIRTLAIATPGWGKTTLFSAAPGAILLAFEEGHKFVKCHKIVIDSWAGQESRVDDDGVLHLSCLEAFARIQKSPRFRLVIVDTIDAMVKMCVDYYVDLYKGSHISDLGDYGKGYELGQNNPIRHAVNSLLKTGRGMAYITHEKIIETKNKKGEVIKTIKACSMPDGVMKIIYPQVDTIIHGEFGDVPEGQTTRDRIAHTEGSEELLAKNRGGVFPPSWIVPRDPTAAWNQLVGFLADPSTVKPAYEEFCQAYGG